VYYQEDKIRGLEYKFKVAEDILPSDLTFSVQAFNENNVASYKTEIRSSGQKSPVTCQSPGGSFHGDESDGYLSTSPFEESDDYIGQTRLRRANLTGASHSSSRDEIEHGSGSVDTSGDDDDDDGTDDECAMSDEEPGTTSEEIHPMNATSWTVPLGCIRVETVQSRAIVNIDSSCG
jgi:hypothetical protein